MSEEQLEQEMAQFEGIMRQMMTLKQADPTTVPNQQRKQQAENLLLQLLGAGSSSAPL